MTSSALDIKTPAALSVTVGDDCLTVDLMDGRTISAPMAWYPRLLHATAAERANHRLMGAGQGIHWPDLDEDISVESLLDGRPSMEGAASLKRWLAGRGAVT